MPDSGTTATVPMDITTSNDASENGQPSSLQCKVIANRDNFDENSALSETRTNCDEALAINDICTIETTGPIQCREYFDVELYEMMRNIFTDDVGHFDQEGCSQFYAMTAELADITYDMLKVVDVPGLGARPQTALIRPFGSHTYGVVRPEIHGLGNA